jgi:septum site-determining protein MinC
MTSPPAVALPSPGPAAGPATSRRQAFDLKGTMASLTVLRLRSTDLVLIERQLRVKIAQLPHLFLDAPVLVDLGALGEEASALAFGELARALRSCKLVPVAVAHVPEGLRGAVTEAGLGVWQPPALGRARGGGDAGAAETTTAETATAETATRDATAAETPSPEVSGAAAAAVGVAATAAMPSARAAHAGPMVVNKPVRGGQIVYAQNNDLVVLAPVNSGAQVIADGHVHIYAPLRGRAVAGAQGLSGARIFCQKLEAELVAISGAYIMAEEIPAKFHGRAVQIFLEGGECKIAAL